MNGSLAGRTAVVTGAGSGIGRATARRLARDDAAVAVWDINGESAIETAELITEAGGRAIAVAVDCSDKAAIAAAAAQSREAFGPLTILVNGAAIVGFTSYLDITDDAWDRMIAVNLRGPHLVCRQIIPDMLEQKWGRIINLTSSSIQMGASHLAHYMAAKGGVFGLTKALAVEFGGTGITANMIPPGSIDTPMLRNGGPDLDAHGAAAPVKRIGQPEDIAAAVAFLASAEASYMTGQTISVNGGRYMGSA